jgi:hypothetical protein
MTVKQCKMKCHVCRKSFVAQRSDAKCCSPRCRQRAHRLAVTNVTAFSPAKPLVLTPIGVTAADEFVQAHHRHAGRVNWGSRFALAVADQSGEIQAVAIVSHPITRALNHGGFVGEVRWVCTRPGAPHNCCSMLYSACWNTWRSMGGTRIITYTLKSETGSSLKAAGWKRVAASPGHKSGSWDTHPRKGTLVNKEILVQDKWRWEVSRAV